MAGPEVKRARLDNNLLSGFENSVTGRNPLLISLVLENILKYCELEDLRQFRLVCTLWHDMLLPRWRNEIILIIVLEENENLFLQRQRLLWKDMHCLFQDASYAVNPFRKFRLVGWKFAKEDSYEVGSWPWEACQIYNTFWNLCGPWMKELELDDPWIEKSSNSFRKAIVEETPNLVSLKLSNMSTFELGQVKKDLKEGETQPNLKSLTISYGVGSWLGEAKRTLILPWMEMFRLFPNLMELEWDEISDINGSYLLNAWSRLRREPAHSERKLNVKCGHLRGSRGHECMRYFVTRGSFSIKKLHLQTDRFEDLRDLSVWLENRQNTLETLELSTHFNISYFFNMFQCNLPFLSKLRLSTSMCINFDFLKNTPNLEALSFDNVKFHDVAKLAQRMDASDFQLKKLSFLQIRKFRNSKEDDCDSMINIFVKFLPNVKVFKCPLTKRSFRTVCENWRGLEVLVDLDDKLDDDVITGIAPDQNSRLPNITDLKCLRAFETGSILSGKAMSDGILRMESLTNINITLTSETSNQELTALSSKFPIGVRRQSSQNKDHQVLDITLKLEAQLMSKNYSFYLNKYDTFL